MWRRWFRAAKRAALLDQTMATALALAASGAAPVPSAPISPMQPDIPAGFVVPSGDWDYTRREVMIPMRDGVKLYTVILVPRGAKPTPPHAALSLRALRCRRGGCTAGRKPSR